MIALCSLVPIAVQIYTLIMLFIVTRCKGESLIARIIDCHICVLQLVLLVHFVTKRYILQQKCLKGQ